LTRKFKDLSDKRALTPVLSTLLLTVVAVAGMALATTATYVVTTNLRQNISERFIVEDLWFNNSTVEINVYLYNVGKVAIHISAVYVNRTSQPFTKPFNLEIGEHKWLNVSENWTAGNLYFVNIVTTRGTHVESYYKAP
jgi:hypothetical protein